MIKSVIAKAAATAGSVVAVAALAASPAQAATSYSDSLTFVGKDIQQTNLLYKSPVVTSAVTPRGPITNLAWQYGFNNAQPANTTLDAYVCGTNATTKTLKCAVAPTSYGSTAEFNGWPSNSSFFLYYQLKAASTYTLTPTSYWGAKDYIWPTFTQG